MKSNNVDAVIFRPYPLQVCLLSFVITFLAITKCLKNTNYKLLFFFSFLSGVASVEAVCLQSAVAQALNSFSLYSSLLFSSFLAWRRKHRSFGSHFVYAGTV